LLLKMRTYLKLPWTKAWLVACHERGRLLSIDTGMPASSARFLIPMFSVDLEEAGFGSATHHVDEGNIVL